MKTRTRIAFFVLAAAACLVRCSNPAEKAPAKQAGTFDAAVAKYEQTLAQLPDADNAHEAIDEITRAAISGGKIKGEQPRLEMILLFQDDNLGLYLFEKACEDLETTKLEQLLQRIESAAPGSAVEAAAFDRRLRGLDPEQAVAACDDVLNAGPEAAATRRGRVALYRRAVCRRQSGMPKQAALDLVRLYALHSKAVGEMKMGPYVSATLKEAGFLLEADMIAFALKPGRTAIALQNEFKPVAGDTAPGQTAQSATELYLRLAPDVAAIEQQVQADPTLVETPLARALHFARMARIALEAVAPEEAAARYQLAAKAAENALGEKATVAEYGELAEVFGTSSIVWRNFAKNGRRLRPNVEAAYKRLETSPTTLLHDMDCLCLDAWVKALPPTKEGAGIMLAEVERVVERCGRGEHETVLFAYEKFLKTYPDAPEAPAVMARLADYCQTRMNDAARAAEIYAGLIQKYPNNPDMEKAVMRHALALYESKDFQAALDTLNAFAEKNPGSRNLPTARYMAALSEAALGLDDQAEAHMTQIVNDYAAAPVAPRAIYWLGMNQVMRQDYDKAAEMFRLLVERYPDSNFTFRARQYIANIEKTSKP